MGVSGTTAEKYAQVGNAVPVRLARIAGEVIASELEKLRCSQLRKLPTQPPAFRKVYIQSHVRTRRWFKDGETLVWGADDDDTHYGSPKTLRKTTTLQK